MPLATVSSLERTRDIFRYEDHYARILDQRKADKSYRYFQNINRLAREFPYAHSSDVGKRIDVWCTNDNVSEGTAGNSALTVGTIYTYLIPMYT
jgi:hypothetical protein